MNILRIISKQGRQIGHERPKSPDSTGVTIYGGVDEIGGNKIIEDKGTRIMLDFGISYADRRKFFVDPMLSPGDERDLLEFGILSNISGIYEFEDSRHMSRTLPTCYLPARDEDSG